MKTTIWGLALTSVLATSLVYLWSVSALGQQTPPRKKFGSRNEFFEAHKKDVIERLGLQPLDLSQRIDRMIQTEMDALDKVALFKTVVTKGEGDQLQSHPESGIIVSPKQLQHIRRQSGVRQFQQILRFLLAHEKSHQIQYLEYTAKAVHQSEKEEQRRVYECQADLLAGKYLIESIVGEPTAEDRVAIEDALQVAFDLGTEEYVETSDHPSHEERRVAVRLGMSAGMITLLSKKLPDAPAKSMIDSLLGKINFREGETIMGWSYRLSKKITHYSGDASADVTLDDKDVEWNPNASTPFVRFSLTYKNKGRRTIKIDMEVQCLSVLRSDRDNSKYWQKWDARNFIFRLGAGETFIVRGRLQWYADDNLIPRLTYPPNPSALMSCEYVN